MLTAVLLLASRGPAMAQAPHTAATQAAARRLPASPFTGSVDVGGIFTATDGDDARYERYRDAATALYSSLKPSTSGARSSRFDANASHIGYRDQQYNADVPGPKVSAGFQWVSQPLNYSYLTRTPYVTNGSTLTLDDSAQRAVQGPTNAANDGDAPSACPCAPGAPPAACSTPALAAQAKANRSIYNTLAPTFDLRPQRDTAAVGLTYAATTGHRRRCAASVGRSGTGSSRGARRSPSTTPSRCRCRSISGPTTSSSAPPGRTTESMFRLGWDGSWFNNDDPESRLGQPDPHHRLQQRLVPPAGPYDPSGYSNGNGPAQGRMALAPDNTMNVVSATGLYKLRGRTTLNGTLQLTSQNQDDGADPVDDQPVIMTPRRCSRRFRTSRSCRAPTAEAEAQGVNTLLNLSSRPYRTRELHRAVPLQQARRADADLRRHANTCASTPCPEEIEEGLSHQFDNSRHIFDANVSFTPGAVGARCASATATRRSSATAAGSATSARTSSALSFDTYSQPVRDRPRRRSTPADAAVKGSSRPRRQLMTRSRDRTGRHAADAALLRRGGPQPDARIACSLTVMPRDTFDVYVQFAGGKDEYLADDSVPVSRPASCSACTSRRHELERRRERSPDRRVSASGANYGRDTLRLVPALAQRQPAARPDLDRSDSRLDARQRRQDQHASVYLDLMRAVRNTDIRFGYDYSDSNNSFVHGGPRIAALAAPASSSRLPDVENTWQRLRRRRPVLLRRAASALASATTSRSSTIVDFNTIDTNGPVGFAPATGDPRIDWLGGLMTGYGNRPYTGHTAYVRVLYRF